MRHGDTRAHTLWETISETGRQRPGSFWLVIDEAHRGMRENGNGDKARKEARTIVQRFIKGSDEVQPVPLVCGISATAQRFTELLGGTPRTQRPVTVEPEDVRSSGLLKETITLFHPDEDQRRSHAARCVGGAAQAVRVQVARLRRGRDAAGRPPASRRPGRGRDQDPDHEVGPRHGP
ncbi:MAG: hypothetical protein H0T96_05705 [Thermoleophilaceae bacterium]|nr:hypothetical protein [Thermoleophilaceae bacterium]